MSWCPGERRFANQANHVLGEVASQQLCVGGFVSVVGCSLADQKCQLKTVLCWQEMLPVSVSQHEKTKVQLAFSFPLFFLNFFVPFGTFQESSKTRKRRMNRRIHGTFDFPHFWTPGRRLHCSTIWAFGWCCVTHCWHTVDTEMEILWLVVSHDIWSLDRTFEHCSVCFVRMFLSLSHWVPKTRQLIHQLAVLN